MIETAALIVLGAVLLACCVLGASVFFHAGPEC